MTTGLKIGYARVSTTEQNLNLQIDALKSFGCDEKYIFTDKITGTKKERPGLEEAFKVLRAGDIFVVWKLDRAGRSIKHLIEMMNRLKDMNIGFVSLQENINTTTPSGRLFFHMFAALAEFEADIIRERTQAGLVVAKARGKVGGRPKSLEPSQVEMLKTLIESPNYTVADIAKTLGVSRATIYNYLKQFK